MREILFKAKRLDTGEWVEGTVSKGFSIIDNFNSIGHYIDFWDEHIECFNRLEVDPNTVCQYTGLKDKNGVKIFEGDCIESGFIKSNLVVWHTQRASFRCKSGDEDYPLPTRLSNWQVTSSIHDKE